MHNRVSAQGTMCYRVHGINIPETGGCHHHLAFDSPWNSKPVRIKMKSMQTNSDSTLLSKDVVALKLSECSLSMPKPKPKRMPTGHCPECPSENFKNQVC